MSLPRGDGYSRIRALVHEQQLHTVCESARCPNLGECWSAGTATFMILGDICTRSCGFCAVITGRPLAVDRGEPARLAQAVRALGVHHAVITSVNRDDLAHGGAGIFAACIVAVRRQVPGCRIEVLIPDFLGNWEALGTVLAAAPDILNHNVETVPRLFKKVQPQDHYEWAAATLSNARKLDPEVLTKSEIMVVIAEVSDAQAFGSDAEVDSLILCRIFRDGAHANDTCTGAAFGLFVDMHFQVGYWATTNKAPNFYK